VLHESLGLVSNLLVDAKDLNGKRVDYLDTESLRSNLLKSSRAAAAKDTTDIAIAAVLMQAAIPSVPPPLRLRTCARMRAKVPFCHFQVLSSIALTFGIRRSDCALVDGIGILGGECRDPQHGGLGIGISLVC
jgi:hypothetical protein